MGTKHVYVGNKGVFYNSDCLFVEYNDIISAPWYILACFIKDIDGIGKMFDISELSAMTYEEIMEWYIFRRYRNIYKNIPLLGNQFLTDEEYDQFLYKQMEFSNTFYTIDVGFTFGTTLDYAAKQKLLIKKVVIYSEYMNPYLEKVLKNRYPDAFLLSGDFREVLHEIPRDSTYVFSDMNKINIMVEEGHLELSSIIMCDGYRYNYLPDDNKKFIADLEMLRKKYTFKIDFFNNFKVL